ncbi:ABC transporter permease [Natronobiforma cellulositropha]|uniref:ABC transporter permease n=1 Tax=Natronobiforma cellulositropha TaxID=1679076 RepID=UPI0021D5FAC1|nr:ABC transporter permease [Natronobiforma cellulositropha]
MAWFVGRRLVWALFATFLVVTLTFALLAASPNPETSQAAWQAAQDGSDPEEARALVDQQHGAGDSLTTQYVSYMVSMFSLDWGQSTTYNEDVTSVIANAWVYSAITVIPATIIAVVVGFGIGLYSATHQYTTADYAATLVAFFGVSIPNFWFAIVLMLVFGELLGLTPISYDSEVPFWSLEHLSYLVLPITVLATAAVASEMRYARAEALEYVSATWTKTARAKGLSETAVTIRHVFRPATVPLVTILVADLVGIIFATAYVVEVIFGIPGLGYVSYQALVRMDTPLVLATTLIPVFVTIVANLCQDLAYTVLDPRIDYEGRSP